MKTLACALALASMLVSPLALAQPRSERAQQQGATTVYDARAFDDDPVTGTVRGPWGDRSLGRVARELDTLIRVRPHFVPEMLKTVENL